MPPEALEALVRVARTMNLRVTLIGALARELVFDTVYAGAPHRATLDINITIRVVDADEFEELARRLVKYGGFQRNSPHRFVYDGGTELDVLPFGGMANETGNLVWPGGRTMRSSCCPLKPARSAASRDIATGRANRFARQLRWLWPRQTTYVLPTSG